MANPLAKPSTSTSPLPPPPVTAEKVVANFTLATSQLIELLGDCKDNSKRGVELTRQVNGVEDRLTSLEQKVTNLPHPPLPPPCGAFATTADIGKAMDTLKADYTKEIAELKKQHLSILDEIKTMRDDREATLKEVFSVSNGADSLRTTLQSAISALVKGVIDCLRKLDSQVSAVQGVNLEKK